ncbi:hypothetical protein M408DRAFT_334208 [Serendipita vermifera MAFF 305830]|uniref:Uncharacterized protein n=1 Tax=Serendipita vermifera MAFF 305830 TaxID=933852 RepID=A0A0C3AKW9_SERVB|nr:hypothetical protein M408DRAFT_334208 [Serendipita vermifera MAFF 305830]
MNSLRPTYDEQPLSRASSIFDLPRHFSAPTPVKTPEILGSPSHTQSEGSFIVLSGGTGCNAFCSAFDQSSTCYVLPVSDDGGSSSEIIRVIGGPSIGDIRSRLIRLIPSPAPAHVDAIRELLGYRFPSTCTEHEAREMWRDVIEGSSHLWKGVPMDRKELIRGFLVYFENEVLKRAHKRFSFRNGSIGNFFLSATQSFFRSLPSAIFQFSSITGSQGTILPVLVTNHTVTIAAELQNGKKIIGQCNISHPVNISDDLTAETLEGLEDDEPSTSPLNVGFEKTGHDTSQALEANIDRVFYINAYGQEIYPLPNPGFLSNLSQRECLVYSCGSLWTSIIPCLALRGVASSIARSPRLRAKILLLNQKNDRETTGYTAIDYIHAITKTLNRHDLTPRTAGNVERPAYPTSAFITHLVYLSNTSISVEKDKITAMGVECVVAHARGNTGFNADIVRMVLDRIMIETSDS